MSETIAKEAVKWLKKIAGKYEQTRGVRVWAETAAGTMVLLRADPDGHLQIDALTVGNPPNLDVLLSTRASETTLTSIDSRVNALIDDTIKGVLRSLGDAGATPINASGRTALQRLYDIFYVIGEVSATPIANTVQDRLRDLQEALASVGTDSLLIKTV